MNVLAVIYIVFALIFLIFTFIEGQRKHLPWGLYRCAGLAMALVWPAALLVAFITSREARAGPDRLDRGDEL